MKNTNDIFVRSESFHATPVDGEMILLDAERGVYFGLNPVARRIWGLLASPRMVSQLLNELTNCYDVEPSQCEKQLRTFLDRLLEHGLIQKSGNAH